MANFSAKDVQELRQASGAGMMDAKKALDQNDGDFKEALQWLKEKGLSATAKRADRKNAEGAVAVSITDDGSAIVELKCETDFVAKNEDFVNTVNELANLVAQKGTDALESRSEDIAELNARLKENIQVGRVIRFEPSSESAVDSYLHVQADRGINAVLVELEGGTTSLAHDVAVHIAFARPQYLTREEVPAEEIEQQRKTFEAISRNEGKPEAALPKIIEGRLQGFYKDTVLLEQPYARDEKQTISQLIGSAKIKRFSQVEVGR